MFAPVPPRPESDEPPGQDPPVALPVGLVDDLREVAGPNANFYLPRWRSALAGGGAGFNRAAFFLGGFWLAYRRMYLWAFAYYALVLAEGVFEEAVFGVLLGFGPGTGLLRFAIGFTAAVVCGGMGNRWYLAHARRVVAGVRAVPMPEVDARLALAARGGTDFLGAVGVLAVSVMAAVGTGFVLGLVLGLT